MSVRVCLHSLGLYLTWWWRSVWSNRRDDSPITLRRFFFLFVLFPLFMVLQLVHWIFWILDTLLFPSTYQVTVRQPIFITGIPRSGTTFVHRSLAHASTVTTFSTWETILAPCICEKRILRGLAAIDQRLGRPLRGSADWLVTKISGDFEAIHGVDLTAPEEDYLALLPFGGCFLLALAFPGARELRDLACLDKVPQGRRVELLALYHQCLQKKLYGCHPKTRLLSKNAAFGSWLPYLAEQYTDAVFLLCVRAPIEALSSQISALAGARTAFGTDPAGTVTAELMKRVFRHNYARLAQLVERPKLQKQCRILEQSDLKSTPAKLLTAAADFANLMECASLRQYLEGLQPAGESAHRHNAAFIPGGGQEFLKETAASYAAILDLDCRIEPT